jgi:hypothetical protein
MLEKKEEIYWRDWSERRTQEQRNGREIERGVCKEKSRRGF